MRLSFVSQAVLIVVLHVTAGAAFAQFAWIDAKGVRQYSDQPPPASVPKNKILKSPGLMARDAPAAVSAADTGASAASITDAGAVSDKSGAAKAPATTAEKNADYIKRKSDLAEKEQKAAEEAKAAAAKARNCEKAQNYARSLQSGERVASLDKNGERSFMTDEKRAQEIGESRRALDGCK